MTMKTRTAIFASTAPATPSSSLLRTPRPSAGDDGAGELADAADDDDEERVDDVALAEVGADVADLRERDAAEAGDAGAEREREHVDLRGVDADARRHAPVLRDAADEQAEARARDQQRDAAEDDRTAKAMIAIRLNGSTRLLITSTPPESQFGFSTGDVLRAEGRAHRLLQDEADAPGREQRLERPAVEEADDAALEHRADAAPRRGTPPGSPPARRRRTRPAGRLRNTFWTT